MENKFNFQHGDLDLTPIKDSVWNPIASLPVYDSSDADQSMEEILVELSDHSRKVAKDFGYRPGTTPRDKVIVEGMEIGDDRGDVSNSPMALAIGLAGQEKVYGMVTSWKDTNISQDVWNLCEVTSYIPRTISGDAYHGKVEGFKNLEFIDTPPLRIILDVQKGDRSHSSSAVGKASMLGSRIRSAKPSCKATLHLASWLQDSMLNTCTSPDPKYLPWVMGGSAVEPLWGNHLNLFAYIKTYKNGSYDRLYATATEEIYKAVQDLDVGRVTQPALCSKLRLRKNYLMATYAANVAIPDQKGTKAVMEGFEPIYKALGGTALYQGVENRLVQAGKLLTSRDAEVKILSSLRDRTFLFGRRDASVEKWFTLNESQSKRAQFDSALQANSAFQRILARNANTEDLIQLAGESDFLIASGGSMEFTKYNSRWITEGGRGVIASIQDLVFSEDMYLVEDVESPVNMRISGIPLTPKYTRKDIIQKRTQNVAGLWQVSESMEEWADSVCSRLKDERTLKGNLSFGDVSTIFFENREWVSDDTLLVARVSEIARDVTSVTIILISADVKLARSMAKTSGLPVALVNPAQVMRAHPNKEWSSKTAFSHNELFRTPNNAHSIITGAPPVYGKVFIDMGSVKAYSLFFEKADDPYVEGGIPLYIKEPIRSGITQDGFRFEAARVRRARPHQISQLKVYYPNGDASTQRVVKDLASRKESTGMLERASRLIKRFGRR